MMSNTLDEAVEATETAFTIAAMATMYALDHVEDFNEFVNELGAKGAVGASLAGGDAAEGFEPMTPEVMAHDLAVAGVIFTQAGSRD